MYYKKLIILINTNVIKYGNSLSLFLFSTIVMATRMKGVNK